MPRTSSRKRGALRRAGPPTIHVLRAGRPPSSAASAWTGCGWRRTDARQAPGDRLPGPVVTTFDETDPLSAVVAAEDARFAAMVVLERLSPDQRVAFVRHDGFAVPFAEVADVLGTNEAAARQLASRARKAISAEPAPKQDPSHNEVVGKLMAAMAEGDLEAVVALLHPDVTLTGDANGKASTAIHIIRGADKVARFMFGLARRYGPAFFTANQLALINGELGAYTAGGPGSDGHWDMAPRITAMTVRDGKVCAIWDIANPDKFTGSLGPSMREATARPRRSAPAASAAASANRPPRPTKLRYAWGRSDWRLSATGTPPARSFSAYASPSSRSDRNRRWRRRRAAGR